MRTIKVKFVDFFDDLPEENFLLRALKANYHVEFSDEPDYLLFSCFGDEHLKYTDCVKIFFSGEDISPDFNLCDYSISFDNLSYGDRHLRFPLFVIWGMKKALEKHNFTEDELAAKTEFCNFVVSNANANPIRGEFYNKLSEYKPILSGGRYMNNIGGPVEDKIAFQEKTKFTIAFENDSSDGYTSEKILDAFKAKTVPIYWGNINIAKDFNPKAFINCHDFESLDAVVEYVKKVDNDPELYRQMLSEPIFANGEAPYELTLQSLEDFFAHIIEQPLGQAKRVCKFSRKQVYLRDYQNKAMYKKWMTTNPAFRIIKKIVQH